MKLNNEHLNNKSDIKILVVDDRDDNLLSIETILERETYSITKANSGRAALKILLNQHDFTLILMDVQMPEMNGFETATLIYQREKLKHIPIIFITAHNHDEEYMFEGYKMGAVDFIYKPINPELLRFKVSVFVDLYRKTHQLMTQEGKLIAANTHLQNEIEERKISEEKVRLLNQQLLQNNTDLKMINEELDQFAYVASHDLQEPLRKILIFSNVISVKLNDKIDADVQNYLDKISKASTRMQNLINDLLKFSRHTHDSDDFKIIDLNELLVDVLSDIEVEVQQRNAQINFQPLPAIWAIPSQMRQLLQNLISNSLKFCKTDQSLEINISSDILTGAEIDNIDASCENQNFCRVYIKDNGIGFDPKYMDDIFVVFKRLHSYHEFEGTGIGLSICKKIVEKHNGYITAESKVNEGSIFIITLPLKDSLRHDTVYNKQTALIK